MAWHDLLLVQSLYALSVLAFVAAGAAFMLASLVLAASRSEFELPVIRALLAAGALLAVVVADQLALGIPFALAWGLAFDDLAERFP